jgi:hypothetical protein
VQSPVRRREATGGIRAAIIIGATVVAGSVHQVADRITYRAGIAADIPLTFFARGASDANAFARLPSEAELTFAAGQIGAQIANRTCHERI